MIGKSSQAAGQLLGHDTVTEPREVVIVR